MVFLQKLSKIVFLKPALRKTMVAPGLYFLGNGGRKFDRILLDLSNPSYSHLGDQLFYQPLIHHLLACGMNITVAPTPAMQDYFRAFYDSAVGAPDDGEFDARTLVILPIWAYESRQQYGNASLLLVDLTDSAINSPLSAWLVSQISHLLDITANDHPDIAHIIQAKLSGHDIPPLLPAEGNVALFNNYIDSGKFRINPNHQKALSSCARRLKQENGLTIVHVGSLKDKSGDPKKYDFIDLDARGKLTPLQLTAYFHQPAVKCAITFDNFIMHASLLANKPCHVRFRGRYTHTARQHHFNYVNQAFVNVPGKNLICYI